MRRHTHTVVSVLGRAGRNLLLRAVTLMPKPVKS